MDKIIAYLVLTERENSQLLQSPERSLGPLGMG